MHSKLITFNAFGTIVTDGKTVTVVLVADTIGGRLHRTVKAECRRDLPIGSALIAASIETGKQYTLTAHEMTSEQVASDPDVVKVLNQVVEWLMESA